jgi:hypothetical protein
MPWPISKATGSEVHVVYVLPVPHGLLEQYCQYPIRPAHRGEGGERVRDASDHHDAHPDRCDQDRDHDAARGSPKEFVSAGDAQERSDKTQGSQKKDQTPSQGILITHSFMHSILLHSVGSLSVSEVRRDSIGT